MLTISQFSKAGRITAKTLRYYDEIGLLSPQKVNPDNGYRYYAVTQLADVAIIQRLKIYDCSLAEIRGVLQDATQLPVLLAEKEKQLQEKMANYQTLQLQLAKDLQTLAEGGDFMSYQNEIELVNSPAMNLFSLRKKMDVKDFGNLLQELFEQIGAAGVTPIGAPMAFYHSDEYTPENYDVEWAVPIAEATKATRTLPAYQAARLIFKGNYQEMPSVYGALSQWLEEHNFQLIEAPFEFYQTDPSQVSADENQVDVYFPIGLLDD
ncbi:MerR family transcriptional regulator [Enterococcus sp. LJL120]